MADYERQIAAIHTDLAVLEWMARTNFALTLAIAWCVFV
jgi:hypothetical protein